MEFFVTDYFKFPEIQNIYRNHEDLKLAFPSAQYPLDSKEWNDWISKPDSKNLSLLFYKNSNLIAHLALKNYLEEPGLCYLCFFIVDPDFRGKGLSKEALSLTYSYVRDELEKDELWLVVSEKNKNAYGLYKKEGFLVLDKRPGGLRMRKKL